MKRMNLLFLYWVFLVILVGSCAHLSRIPDSEFVKTYIRNGIAYEKKGDPVAALKQFRLALTIAPYNQEVILNCKRLETKLRKSAESHFGAGLKLDKEGRYQQARQEFLTAIRLCPNHREAIKMITARKRIQAEQYIVHTISPGESLSKIAKTYYGDRRKFPILAKYNELTDATNIRIGQKIKIPKLKDMKLPIGKNLIVREEIEPLDSDQEEEIDQVEIYRDLGIDLFRQHEYQEAIVEFEKVLGARPDDNMALEYSFKSHFQIAMALYKNKEYLPAIESFKLCLKLNNTSQKCHAYLKKCEKSYKEIHYRKGMQFFDKEQLSEAIREWQLIKDIDPKYKRVEYLINKARKILNKLEELKSDKQ